MVRDSGSSVSIRFVFIGGVQELNRYRCRVSWVTLLFHAEGFKLSCVAANE